MKKLLILLMSLVLLTACGGKDDDSNKEIEMNVDPQNVLRYAGYAMDGDLPVAVWVDFDSTSDKIARVTLTGYANPSMEAVSDKLAANYANTKNYVGQTAKDAEGLNSSALDEAVSLAAKSYLANKDSFVIRDYQSVMTSRYVANSPYIVDNANLSGDVFVSAEIVATYPSDALTFVSGDVMSGDKVKFPEGNNAAKFTNEAGTEYTIKTPVALANNPGIAVIAYTYEDKTIYSALDIYDNFTLSLSGSDAYGNVVYTIEDNDDVVTYRVLGDKAMNFPGGTCGSTVIDVTIDKKAEIIRNVHVYESSDSTYLKHPWEYGGGFIATGEFIQAIDNYTNAFANLSAKLPITAYTIADKDHPDGGLVVEGGVDYVVSGATRTANAIVYAVNSAIEAFNK